MSKRKKTGLVLTILFTFFFLFLSLILVDQLTNWDIYEKLIIPGAIFALGILITIVISICGRAPATTPTTTATAPCPTPAPAPPPKSADKKKAVPGDGGWFSLIFGLALLVGGGYWIIYCAIPWVYSTPDRLQKELPDHPPYISGITPIGHNASNPAVIPTPKKPNPNLFYKVLQPGIVYDVFPLENKQIWEWDYLQSNLAYRVKATGREPFTVLAENAIRSQEWAAQYAGTLQIKTILPGNRVRLIRKNRFDM